MKVGVLFSGGKDSCYSAYLAKRKGYEISCLISIFSKNKNSYMFHTPSIKKTKLQAKVMEVPLISRTTKGVKEKELKDLKKAILKAKKKYGIEGVVTGAVKSVYQLSRVQKICNELKLKCFNPLWQKDQFELLQELINNNFLVIVTGVFAYPLDENWLGKRIDKKFIREVKELNEKYGISPAGEGGEFETFVLDCPLFKRPLEIRNKKIFGKDHSWRMEVKVR